MRIESRKGILSRKSSVNKNSFYKQKQDKFVSNKLYGSGNPPSNGLNGTAGSSGLPGVIANRGSSSYFNKSGVGGFGGQIGSSGGLPGISSGGITANNPKPTNGLGSYGVGSFNKNSAIGQSRGPPGLQAFSSYKHSGLSGGIGGTLGTSGGGRGDPYNNQYQENS